MTAKHLSVAIIIFVFGTFVGTGQTLLVQNLPSLEAQFGISQDTPKIVSPIPAPTHDPKRCKEVSLNEWECDEVVTPTATPSATPTPTIIRHRYVPVVETPTPTL